MRVRVTTQVEVINEARITGDHVVTTVRTVREQRVEAIPAIIHAAIDAAGLKAGEEALIAAVNGARAATAPLGAP